jgi:hypothetical protein
MRISVRRGLMWRWRDGFSSPLVKVVTSVSLSLFVALNLPLVFLAILVAALSYVAVLVGVACAYRNCYRIIGKPEIAIRFVAKASPNLREKCQRTVARTLEEHERRQKLKREKNERLRRYKRERNREKRERARRALAER